MNLYCFISNTTIPEFGIYFYSPVNGIFVIQIGLYNRVLEISFG